MVATDQANAASCYPRRWLLPCLLWPAYGLETVKIRYFVSTYAFYLFCILGPRGYAVFSRFSTPLGPQDWFCRYETKGKRSVNLIWPPRDLRVSVLHVMARQQLRQGIRTVGSASTHPPRPVLSWSQS